MIIEVPGPCEQLSLIPWALATETRVNNEHHLQVDIYDIDYNIYNILGRISHRLQPEDDADSILRSVYRYLDSQSHT